MSYRSGHPGAATSPPTSPPDRAAPPPACVRRTTRARCPDRPPSTVPLWRPRLSAAVEAATAAESRHGPNCGHGVEVGGWSLSGGSCCRDWWGRCAAMIGILPGLRRLHEAQGGSVRAAPPWQLCRRRSRYPIFRLRGAVRPRSLPIAPRAMVAWSGGRCWARTGARRRVWIEVQLGGRGISDAAGTEIPAGRPESFMPLTAQQSKGPT